MLSISDKNFQLLSDIAAQRGVKVQELIRAVIIPDWSERHGQKTGLLNLLENRLTRQPATHSLRPSGETQQLNQRLFKAAEVGRSLQSTVLVPKHRDPDVSRLAQPELRKIQRT